MNNHSIIEHRNYFLATNPKPFIRVLYILLSSCCAEVKLSYLCSLFSLQKNYQIAMANFIAMPSQMVTLRRIWDRLRRSQYRHGKHVFATYIRSHSKIATCVAPAFVCDRISNVMELQWTVLHIRRTFCDRRSVVIPSHILIFLINCLSRLNHPEN